MFRLALARSQLLARSATPYTKVHMPKMSYTTNLTGDQTAKTYTYIPISFKVNTDYDTSKWYAKLNKTHTFGHMSFKINTDYDTSKWSAKIKRTIAFINGVVIGLFPCVYFSDCFMNGALLYLVMFGLAIPVTLKFSQIITILIENLITILYEKTPGRITLMVILFALVWYYFITKE